MTPIIHLTDRDDCQDDAVCVRDGALWLSADLAVGGVREWPLAVDDPAPHIDGSDMDRSVEQRVAVLVTRQILAGVSSFDDDALYEAAWLDCQESLNEARREVRVGGVR